MSLTTEAHICQLIMRDPWRMEMLRFARAMNLPDWCIGAGFVRALVWDTLVGNKTPYRLPDLDLVYFDPANIDPDHDFQLRDQLNTQSSSDLWDVKNQARMHSRNDDPPYRDTAEALSNWLETPPTIAIRLEANDTPSLIAPLGIDDLLALRVRPTAAALRKPDQYRARMEAKNWAAIWPGLIVEDC